jgi:uncharacterized membrane protein
MSVMLLFTALGHFMHSKGMQLMIPAAVPFKKALVALTANINAARKGLNYQTGNYDGPGKKYLRLRIPLQVLIVWVILFG